MSELSDKMNRGKLVSHVANLHERGRTVRVFIEIKWDGKRLSISGVEGPYRNGDAFGSSGQIRLNNPNYEAVEGVDLAAIDKIWERWHLNDMRAGSPRQELFIRGLEAAGWEHPYDPEKSWYEAACEKLEEAGLLYDEEYLVENKDGEKVPYKYGTAWLFEEVPHDLVKTLFELPDHSVVYPWK